MPVSLNKVGFQALGHSALSSVCFPSLCPVGLLVGVSAASALGPPWREGCWRRAEPRAVGLAECGASSEDDHVSGHGSGKDLGGQHLIHLCRFYK